MDGAEIQILSDLHLETPSAYDIYEVQPSAPYLALLGDIGNTRDDGLFQFIRWQLHRFKVVFFLFGNHEPYHSSWASARSRVREFQIKHDEERKQGKTALGEFVFLDQTRYDLTPKVTVLGCTLHSRVIPSQLENISLGLNDFYQIEDWTVEQHTEAHESDVAWLNQQTSLISQNEPHRRIIIMSHHCPTFDPRTRAAVHLNSPISSGFSTALEEEACWNNDQVKVWAFGHTHHNCDFRAESGPRLLANQRGYYFAQAESFRPELSVKI